MQLDDLLVITLYLLYESLWASFGANAFGMTPGRRMLRFLLSWPLGGLPGFIVGLFIGRRRARRAATAAATQALPMEPAR